MAPITPFPSPVPVPVPAPPPSTKFKTPLLRLRVDDLSHPGVPVFFGAVDATAIMHRAVSASVRWLYTQETAPTQIQEIVLILLEMPNGPAAATSGTRTHKEIRMSLDYILSARERAADEITGVIVHEVVHCFQYDAGGSCPGGLIEGIADYVRLREGLAPPHWKENGTGRWDAGYETTAYFLNWLNETWGDGTVRALNAALGPGKRYTARIFEELTGAPPEKQWEMYTEMFALRQRGGKDTKEEEEERREPLDDWPMPNIAVRIDNLDHKGAGVFLGAVNPRDVMRAAVLESFRRLYTLADVPTNVKSITLILRDMDGVAYTCGNEAHKEIHYSLEWASKNEARARSEISGVLVHEVVHCFQYDARGTCPGGLIEGIADYVRLHAQFAPPHWRRQAGDKWDAGYERTAYFLAWLEDNVASGEPGTFVRRLNARMKRGEYDARVFEEFAGKPVEKLWADYCKYVKDEDHKVSSGDAQVVLS